MTELMGERALLIDRNSNTLVKLSEYFERNRASIEAHIEGNGGARKPIAEIWDGIFPFVIHIGGDEATTVGLVALDSVKIASVNVTNAIGATQSRSIALCETLMMQTAAKFDCYVVALHHHLAVPTGKSWRERFKSAFMVFENAAELLQMLTRRGEPSVVFHGHRHLEYVGTAADSDVAIVATASATVGEHGQAMGGSWRVVELLAQKRSCRLQGTSTRHIASSSL
jgi:hypothetical protein